MMVIWRRRRPALWVQFVRVVAIVGSAAGLAVGAEFLRRKLGIGVRRVEVIRRGRGTRVRVSLRTSKGAGRRPGRAALTASRS